MRIELSDRKPNEYKIDRERERERFVPFDVKWLRKRENLRVGGREV